MAAQDERRFVDTPRWNVGFGADPWFQRTFPSKWPQRAAKVVAVVVVVGLVCFLLGLGIGQAVAAPARDQTSSRCVDMHQEPCRRAAARWAAERFREGRMGHANHRAAWFFRHPRVAKRTIHRMVRHKLARIRSRGTAGRTLRLARYYTGRLWRGSTCDGQGTYSPYSYGFDLCEFAGPSPMTTKQQLQTGGMLVLCGAGVALGWWNGAGAALIAVGATTCGWSLWLGMDPAGERPVPV
ncbi:MAG: hypothetical protein HOV66_24115 [Streptomycetaceae bacterium]|nr:hypothetical protein [Streptomycetaceae bacterium]